MSDPRHLYFPTQPKRCAQEDTGLAGACLACGARPLEICRAPPKVRKAIQKTGKPHA